MGFLYRPRRAQRRPPLDRTVAQYLEKNLNEKLQELKRLAQAVPDMYTPPSPWEESRTYSKTEVAGLEFLNAATPAIVLELLSLAESQGAAPETQSAPSRTGTPDVPDQFTQGVYTLLAHAAANVFKALDFHESQQPALEKIKVAMRQAMSDRMGEELKADLYARSAEQAKAAAVATDTERLDFLTEREAWVAWSKDRESCRVFVRNDEGASTPMMGWGAQHSRKSAREAIDAAMQSTAGVGQ